MTIIESTWHKASYSKADSNCVETACTTDGGAAVRDTQHRQLGHLSFSGEEWAAFLTDVKDGRL